MAHMKLQTCRIQCMLSVCIGPRNLYGRPQNHEKPPVELTNTPSQKAPTRHWLLGPRPMEFSHKSRESFVRAWSWPRAAATEAAPSLPQSVAVQLAGSFKRWGAMHFWTHFTHFQTIALSTHLEFSCLQQAQASLNTSPELLASNFRRPSRKKTVQERLFKRLRANQELTLQSTTAGVGTPENMQQTHPPLQGPGPKLFLFRFSSRVSILTRWRRPPVKAAAPS